MQRSKREVVLPMYIAILERLKKEAQEELSSLK